MVKSLIQRRGNNPQNAQSSIFTSLFNLLIVVCCVATVVHLTNGLISSSDNSPVYYKATTDNGKPWQSSSNDQSAPSHHDLPASTTRNLEIADWNHHNPLDIPRGQAQNLPSITQTQPEQQLQLEPQDDQVEAKRKQHGYGGQGDGKHLGGFTKLDTDGISPNTWRHLISDYGVHSMIDVGCGRGFSTSWFLMHGVDAMCVEGSHDAIVNSVLPNPATQVVEHDFSRGPWWPAKTYDMAWSVEFLEHVNVQYQFNYVSTFRKAAIIFVTSSRWGGWHHVEVHKDDWWIRKYEAYGFKYDDKLTQQVRGWARSATNEKLNGKPLTGTHIWMSMKVFINPVVAALPQHAHLFPEHGCYDTKLSKPGNAVLRECGTGNFGNLETPLDPAYYPLNITQDMDNAWTQHIENHLSGEASNFH